MKRLVLALALVLVTVLVMAGGTLALNQVSESARVVMDTVYVVFPPDYDGSSVELDAGALTTTVELVGEGPTRPVHFQLMGYRGSDEAATIDLGLSASNPSQSVTRELAGGLYNVLMQNQWPVSPEAGLATITNYSQRVRVRMAYASGSSPVVELPIATRAAEVMPTVDEKAAAIKGGLVASITRFHNGLTGELADALANNGFDSNSPISQAFVGFYFDAIMPAARDDAMLGQYLRYMGPALEVVRSANSGSFPKVLLEDRFLDHFSGAVARTGLPPTYPAVTNAEITRWKSVNDMIDELHPGESRRGWPYSRVGAQLLGK